MGVGEASWVEENHMEAVEIKFLRAAKGCRREDRIRNAEIRTELQIYSSRNRITENIRRWVNNKNKLYPANSSPVLYTIRKKKSWKIKD